MGNDVAVIAGSGGYDRRRVIWEGQVLDYRSGVLHFCVRGRHDWRWSAVWDAVAAGETLCCAPPSPPAVLLIAAHYVTLLLFLCRVEVDGAVRLVIST
jgi:hypothetical protein